MSEEPKTVADDDDSNHEAPSFGLVMPFVLCASRGGPHEDESFVSGYRMGLLSADLRYAEGRPGVAARSLYANEYDQADLLAMQHGYRMTVTPTEEPDDPWVWAEFTAVLPEGVDRG